MQKSSCQQDGFLNALFRSFRLKIKNSVVYSLKQLHFLYDSTRSTKRKSKVTHNTDTTITSVATSAEPRNYS